MFGTSSITTANVSSPFMLSHVPGPYPSSEPVRAWANRVVEKVRVAVAGGLRFLPRLDNYTEETSEIRAAYRMMLKEPVLKTAHRKKVETVSQLPWSIVPPDRSNKRDKEIAEFVKYVCQGVKGGTVHIGRAVLRGGLVDGYGVSEKVQRPTVERKGRWKGKQCLHAIKAKDINFCTLSTDQFRNVTGVRPLSFGIGHVFDPADFLIYTHDSLFESVLGTSDHRAAYRWWWLKDTATKLQGLYLDKYAMGALKGTYTTIDQKAALEEALENYRSNSWLTVPLGTLIEPLTIATGHESEFLTSMRYYDEQMLIATTGGFLPVLEGQTPDGRGNTAIQKDTSTLFEWAIAVDLMSVVNEQLIPDIVDRNYWGADYPTLELGATEDSDLAGSLAIDKGLQEMGWEHDDNDIGRRYGREKAENGKGLKPGGAKADEKPPFGGDAPGGMPFAEFAERQREEEQIRASLARTEEAMARIGRKLGRRSRR